MRLLDIFRPKKQDVTAARSALEEARDPNADSSAITRLIERFLSVGLNGRRPYPGSVAIAEKALRAEHGDTEAAIERLIRTHTASGAVGGFVTSLGGFVTMPVAVPANVVEFYVQATRLVGAIAHLRGYDISRSDIRSAVLLTLVGSNAQDVLAKAGVPMGAVGGGAVLGVATKNLPKSALMIVNKAVGFQVVKSVGERTLTRLGRAIPLAGGVIGGGLDGWMMKTIGAQARHEFPPVADQA